MVGCMIYNKAIFYKKILDFIKELHTSVDWRDFFRLIFTILFWVSLAIIPFLFLAAFLYILSLAIGHFASLDRKNHYIALFVFLSILAMFVFRRVALISLSSQSLAHRRNIFFAFFLVFLIENFNLDVTGFFRASSTENSESISIELAAKGILALFAIYSFIEYAHNLLFDFIRSKNDPQIINNAKFFRVPKTSDIWLVLIGNYRFLFDIALPVAISMFIFVIYSEDIESLLNVSIEYFKSEVAEYLEKPKNGNIKDIVDIIVFEFRNVMEYF